MKAIDYLLENLSQKFGIIDFKKPNQVSYLYRMMLDLDIPVDMISESISILTEENPLKKKKAKIAQQKGLKSIGFNNYEDKQGNKFTWNDEKQDIIPSSDDDPKDKTGDKETDEPKKSEPQNIYKGDETAPQPDEDKSPPVDQSWAGEKETGDVAHDLKVDADKEKEDAIKKAETEIPITQYGDRVKQRKDHEKVDKALHMTNT